jgi:hypothetical protein
VRVHVLHGLALRSPLALGGEHGDGGPAVEPGTPVDLALGLGPAAPVGSEPPPGEPLVSFSLGEVPVYSAGRDGGSVRLRVHGLCEFELEPERHRARCRPAPGASLGQIALVARGAFLALWLGLGGECTLHASAVEHNGRSVVFVGGSGMGKSTLAAWACAAGAKFVCDDLLRVSPSGPPRWVGRSPELRLRPSAEAILEGRRRRWDVRRSADGRWAALPPVAEEHHGAIGAVVVPRPSREARALCLERLQPVDAVLALARFPRLEGWRLPAALEAHLDGAARISAAVPVFVAEVPWGPPFPVAVAEQLVSEVLDASAAGAGATR